MENLTDTQLQEIIKDICQKEKETHNLDVEVFVMTPIRFYKKELKKIINSDESLPSKMFDLTLPLIAAGAHGKGSKQGQNSILIFLDSTSTFFTKFPLFVFSTFVPIDSPQKPQNFEVSGTFSPHFLQNIITNSSILKPIITKIKKKHKLYFIFIYIIIIYKQI